MSSASSYRSRLNHLEQSVSQERTSISWTVSPSITYYISFSVVIFALLYFIPPSFLLTPKHKSKKKPQTIIWVRWIGAWVLLSAIVCSMYYLYLQRTS